MLKWNKTWEQYYLISNGVISELGKILEWTEVWHQR